MTPSKRGKSRRNKSGEKLLGSHQRCWIWGRHAVREILEAGRWTPIELVLSEGLPSGELRNARELAEKRGAAVRVESAERLTQLCHVAEHQGYLAKMPPFPYADASEILSRIDRGGTPAAPAGASARGTPVGEAEAPASSCLSADTASANAVTLVILDAIQDPFNFGAIVRSAEALGVDGVFIGEDRQVEVTSMVARASAGAVNRLPIARVGDLADLATQLRALGVRILGASEKAGQECAACDFRRPAAIVLGSEGAGISPPLLEICDGLVRVPQRGVIASLNVAAAAAILFYEARRQKTGINPQDPFYPSDPSSIDRDSIEHGSDG
ncbi:MAG TPA: 23S rRNA (guanosine(2251)-2'-O)-methyltransferase RlmB [Sumerlaeia bacterium]|nr:23S rRNA (guanosine(2251)-2'-O)-methyltransferase RlmB [Sumerlaeia bacterium]